jgi:predicted ATP-dependent protease
MEGAKRAGVKLVLYPKENQKDIEKIKERNNELFKNGFTIKSVETIYDVINYAIVS